MEKMYQAHPEIFEIDRKRRRKTTRVILLAITVLVIFIVSAYFIATYFVKSSHAYNAAIEHISDNKAIALACGGVKDYSVGSFKISTENGQGEANFDITVEGKKEDIDVYIELEKEYGGKWKVINMSY